MLPDIHDKITQYLTEKGVSWEVDDDSIIISHNIQGQTIKLAADNEGKFPHGLPVFRLLNRHHYGLMAHIDWNHDNDKGTVCIGHTDSISCDFNSPVILFYKALENAIDIVTKSLADTAYNKTEILNEYVAHWACSSNVDEHSLICMVPHTAGITDLVVRSASKQTTCGLDHYQIILPKDKNECNDGFSILQNAKDNKRQNKHKSCSLEINNLQLPPAPNESINEWWKKQLKALSPKLQSDLKNKSRITKAKIFYIIFHSKISSGTAWFSIKCTSKTKQRIPLTLDEIDNWKLDACEVKVFSKENILPRGGGQLDLQKKKVCIIGCGSIGGHIANQLCTSGVGSLHLADPDWFDIENTYRHVLNPNKCGLSKAISLKAELEYTYPYLTIETQDIKNSSLLDFRETKILDQFDLVIVAVGSPTDERAFNEFMVKNGVLTPVIYTWLEGYGVGGHSVLVDPATDGCLSCCYIDNTSCEPSLSPNLSFIEGGQVLFRNQGGCGSQFMPYSNLDAMQTALIASKLALRSLNEEIGRSMTVSWKGNSYMANANNIKLTHRFQRFDKNLQEIPLVREECDVCQ